jgi:hypothetical protein
MHLENSLRFLSTDGWGVALSVLLINYIVSSPAPALALDLAPVDEACTALSRHIALVGVFQTKALVWQVQTAKANALSPFRKVRDEAEVALLATGRKVGVAGISKVAVTLRSGRYTEARAKYEAATSDLRKAEAEVNAFISGFPAVALALAR